MSTTPKEELAELRKVRERLEQALEISKNAERSMGMQPLIEAALEETRKDIEALRNVVAEDPEPSTS